ncbi:nickel pincer cofactor biosynthesis protein LarB [Paenibacillus sp. KS-LC4]|uniref:nickel pincer cofactor biosynthesis protein LarB n=1 Tax=Paenibacillus sp. KS-LC4 TaxID=2979727 RepID=UPI0030D0F607
MLESILKQVQDGSMSIEDALKQMAPFENLGFAKVDHHRKKRQGFPEIIYGENKSVDHIIGIAQSLQEQNNEVLVTRITEEKADAIRSIRPDFIYDGTSRLLYWKRDEPLRIERQGYIAVIAAGTSDISVAEEAAVTAEVLGSKVHRIYDVGVAGIHRLLHHAEEIQQATVSVVVAGMEGALASVVGGLVSHPVIAVPTSVGYGASFNGLSALLTMLNSCASGISVVNIDNGFGGGYNAALIHQLIHKGER